MTDKSITPRPQATVKRIAELLAKTGRHVCDLCARGELEYTGTGRGFRIFLDSVAAYQERERQKTRRKN